MIFNDKKIDNAIDKHNIIHLSFITENAVKYFKQIIMAADYQDITGHFINHSSDEINTENTLPLLNSHNNIFCINDFYNHWVIKKGLPYKSVTWDYYSIFKQMLPNVSKKLIILSYKRSINQCLKNKIEIIDNVLFCDFLDLYIYPLYHEYKLYIRNLATFSKFQGKLIEAGEMPKQFNVSMIQYMKINGNATEKIFY